MYELIRHLIAFKYACKINHWSTDNYSKHLLFDRLSEDIDDWVDSIAEINPIIVIGHEYLPIPFRKSGFVWHG